MQTRRPPIVAPPTFGAIIENAVIDRARPLSGTRLITAFSPVPVGAKAIPQARKIDAVGPVGVSRPRFRPFEGAVPSTLRHKEDKAAIAAEQTLQRPAPSAIIKAARLGAQIVTAARKHISLRDSDTVVAIPSRPSSRLSPRTSAARSTGLAVAAPQELPTAVAVRLSADTRPAIYATRPLPTTKSAPSETAAFASAKGTYDAALPGASIIMAMRPVSQSAA